MAEGLQAITLWQPWATLLAIGEKKYETRSWAPPPEAVGRPIAIHAAARKAPEEGRTFEILAALDRLGLDFDELPRGEILAIATLHQAVAADEVARGLVVADDHDELAFGDFSEGRFAWRFGNLRRIKPVAAVGMQKIWTVPEELLPQLRAAYSEAENG